MSEAAGAFFFRKRPCPPFFVVAENGDAAKALAKWHRTLEWRAELNVDGLLEEPQAHYEVIKQAYTHAFHGRSRGEIHIPLPKPTRSAHFHIPTPLRSMQRYEVGIYRGRQCRVECAARDTNNSSSPIGLSHPWPSHRFRLSATTPKTATWSRTTC